MTKYEVSGDGFKSDSVSIKQKPPKFYNESVEDSQFAPTGFGHEVNYSDENIQMNSGYVRLHDGTEPWHVFFDGRDIIEFESSSGTTYVYVAFDVDDSALYYEANSTDTQPSDPSLKILEVDAGSQTVKRLNRSPSVVYGNVNFKDETNNIKREIKYDSQLDNLVMIEHE